MLPLQHQEFIHLRRRPFVMLLKPCHYLLVRNSCEEAFPLSQLLHEAFPQMSEIHGQRNGLCNLVHAHLGTITDKSLHPSLCCCWGPVCLAVAWRRCCCSHGRPSASLHNAKYSRDTSVCCLYVVVGVSGKGSGFASGDTLLQ